MISRIVALIVITIVFSSFVFTAVAVPSSALASEQQASNDLSEIFDFLGKVWSRENNQLWLHDWKYRAYSTNRYRFTYTSEFADGTHATLDCISVGYPSIHFMPAAVVSQQFPNSTLYNSPSSFQCTLDSRPWGLSSSRAFIVTYFTCIYTLPGALVPDCLLGSYRYGYQLPEYGLFNRGLLPYYYYFLYNVDKWPVKVSLVFAVSESGLQYLIRESVNTYSYAHRKYIAAHCYDFVYNPSRISQEDAPERALLKIWVNEAAIIDTLAASKWESYTPGQYGVNYTYVFSELKRPVEMPRPEYIISDVYVDNDPYASFYDEMSIYPKSEGYNQIMHAYVQYNNLEYIDKSTPLRQMAIILGTK